MTQTWTPTVDEVYAALDRIPSSAAVVGLSVVGNRTGSRPTTAKYESIPQALRRHGLSVYSVQKALDTLEGEGRAVRVVYGSQKGYVSDVFHAEHTARYEVEASERRARGLREQAKKIVLERHADEIEAVLAELVNTPV